MPVGMAVVGVAAPNGEIYVVAGSERFEARATTPISPKVPRSTKRKVMLQ